MNYLIIPLLLFGGIPIRLSILAGKPIFGVLGAIILLSAYFGYLLEGAVIGAAYTLQNPPKAGETKVEANFMGRAIWESQTIIFNTKKMRGVIVKWKHKRIWLMVRDDIEHGLGYKEIIKKHRLKITDETLRTIIEEEIAGEQD